MRTMDPFQKQNAFPRPFPSLPAAAVSQNPMIDDPHAEGRFRI